jgi:hypothetical protein
MFSRILQSLRDSGVVVLTWAGSEKPAWVSIHNMEESVEEISGASTRTAALKFVYQKTTELMLTWTAIALLSSTASRPYTCRLSWRAAFGWWRLQKYATNPHFLPGILFTKETWFTYDSIINFHNTRGQMKTSRYFVVKAWTSPLNMQAGIAGGG